MLVFPPANSDNTIKSIIRKDEGLELNVNVIDLLIAVLVYTLETAMSTMSSLQHSVVTSN